MHVGQPLPERLLPEPLVRSFQRFLLLAGILFAVGTLTPITVGAYPQSLEAAHHGRLFLYALSPLFGVLGLQVGEELAGPRPVRLAGLLLLGWALIAPFIAAYTRWTGTAWASSGLVLAYVGIVFVCCAFLGALLGAVIQLDERRFVTKYLALALIMAGPLPSPLTLSPLVAVPEIWEGQLVAAATGLVFPLATALLSLGVMGWKAHSTSSGAHGAGANSAGRSVER